MTLPLFLALLASFGVGFFLAWLCTRIGLMGQRKINHEEQRAVQKIDRDEVVLALREKLKELAIENSELHNKSKPLSLSHLTHASA